MEEQKRMSKQDEQDDVEAHIRPSHKLQDEAEPTDEHGRRFRSGGDDDDDVEAHVRA